MGPSSNARIASSTSRLTVVPEINRLSVHRVAESRDSSIFLKG